MIELTDFIEQLLRLGISGNTLTGLVDLVRGFKQERLHLAFGEAAVEIKERAVLGTAGVAVAIGFATFKESLDQRSMQDVGRELKGAQQMGLALAQRQSGRPRKRLYPTHIYM